MYVENIHVLEFKKLLHSINEKVYKFDMDKPSKRQLGILYNRAVRITEDMVFQLKKMVNVIGHCTGMIFFTSDDDPISLESDYEFVITKYEKGLFANPRHYALWNSTDGLKTRGCITGRRDIAEVCKKYWLSRVNEILSLSEERYDIESAQPADFLFHGRLKGDSILIGGGKRSYDLGLPVNLDAYKRFVDDRVRSLTN